MSQSGPHDEFLELCAVSTSGELTDDEQKRLGTHLAICASCREALRQYESIVEHAIPAIAASEEPGHEQPDQTWSQEQQEPLKRRYSTVSRVKRSIVPGEAGKRNGLIDLPPSPPPILKRIHLATCLDALCCRNSSFLRAQFLRLPRGHASRDRPSKGCHNHNQPGRNHLPAQSSLEEQLSDAGHDREIVAYRDRATRPDDRGPPPPTGPTILRK